MVLVLRIANMGGAPTTIAIQESYNGTDWHEMKYLVNTRSSYAEDPDAIPMAEAYAPYSFTGFDANTRYIRIWQLESSSDNASSVNTYFSGVFLYGTPGGNTPPSTGVGKDAVNHGVAVYPNPVNDELYLQGEKEIVKVDIVNLQTGSKVYSVTGNSTRVSTGNLAGGAYLVLIYVQGDSRPQVVKINKR
jgi:hypothetical protein